MLKRGMELLSAGDDIGSAGDALTLLHFDGPFRAEEHVDAGAELDVADAVTSMDGVARLFVADNPAGDEAGDLGEDDLAVGAFDGDEVLLVIGSGFFPAGDKKLAGLVFDFRYFAGDGRAVYMDVEDVEEDADAGLGTFGFNGDHHTVRWRNGDGAFWNLSIGITEEPEAEDGEDQEGDAVGGFGEVTGEGSADQKTERVINSVDDHAKELFSQKWP